MAMRLWWVEEYLDVERLSWDLERQRCGPTSSQEALGRLQEDNMTKAEKEIYEYGNKILKTGSDSFDWNYPYQYQHTERCIEVPWLASMLNKYKIKSLLDVGFTFASHDYLRLLLDWAKSCRLSGTDIINPQKVRGRYPEEWWREINNIDIYTRSSLVKDTCKWESII